MTLQQGENQGFGHNQGVVAQTRSLPEAHSLLAQDDQWIMT